VSDYAPPPDLEIIILDSLTLRMSALDHLGKNYPVLEGGQLKVTTRYGGPAAGGGPEIAVLIVIGELLRRGTSDAYTFVKEQIKELLGRVDTRPPTRFYPDGAIGIVVDSPTKALRIVFAFAEGTTPEEFDERMTGLEDQADELLKHQEGLPYARPKDDEPPVDIQFRWSADEGKWRQREGAGGI
jgi:hypothetical protein